GVPGPDILRESLGKLGYVEGQNLALEIRLSTTSTELRPQARELVDRQVDVIVTSTASGAQAAREATSPVPIVSAGVTGADLVEVGLAESQARPGGNVTGLTTFDADLVGKRLQLLTEIVPSTARVAVLQEASTIVPFPRELYARAADRLGVQ